MKIVQAHKERVEVWDYTYIGTYNKNEYMPDKNKYAGKEIHIKIKCNYCDKESDVLLRNFKVDFHRDTNCCCHHYENSFAYYIQNKLQEPLNKYWDWEKNTVNPYCITPKTNKFIYIKCTKTNYHGSYKTTGTNFVRCLSKNSNNDSSCPYCYNLKNKVHPKDSFAQKCIDTIDKYFLEKYWSDKNTINPWSIAPRSHKKVWIKCNEKDYHGDYEMTCDNYVKRNNNGNSCPLCHSHGKIHKLDSFGNLYPHVSMYWSNKNKKSPYEVAPKSNNKFWFVCEKCGKEFKRQISSATYFEKGSVCCDCRASLGEVRIKEFLNKHAFKENDDYFYDKVVFKDLLSNKGYYLRPDFILPKLKIWIEYDGEFHFEDLYKDGSYENLLANDKIKNQYANKYNWNMTRIPYWEFDNIETILKNIFEEVI